ncbi:MAG: high frequency lysogenization protein HflD [Candidatus Poribacteria bacterium]|nr:high frequency lysogenization protein HflD [Candidatus Poribacteria bacterium]
MKKHYLFIFSVVFIGVVACTLGVADEGHEHSGDRIKELINRPLTLQLAIAALVISFVLGGLHALTPGHGKAIVAAYLVGSKGRVIDAVFLGLVVTFTHTFSVIALGVVMLVAQEFAPEDIVPWLSLFSGILIVGIGAWLLAKNIRQYYTGGAGSHNHGHPHDHDHAHDHNHGQNHDHGHAHDQDHDHGHTHSHGGQAHTHAPPERTGFWGLLSLGISGGIVPCVDALIGLLFAISLGKLVWGLIILSAFSLGLAAVLVAIGILMVMAKPFIERFTGEGVWLQRLPIFSAAVVILLGAILVFKAINSVGVHI